MCAKRSKKPVILIPHAGGGGNTGVAVVESRVCETPTAQRGQTSNFAGWELVRSMRSPPRARVKLDIVVLILM
jgi:hypothetical protein